MSSIYFDNQLPLSDAPGSAKCVAWSSGEDAPLFAAAEGTKVRVFREDGEEILDMIQSRTCACSSVTWHPRAQILVAGWEDGAVTLIGPGDANREDREVHRDATVLCIAFNPAGSRCVTADKSGVVAVWKTDAKGTMSQMCNYRKSGSHDKIIFRTMTPHGEPKLDNPPFFFGGEKGTIYLADDFGLCSERYNVGSPLAFLEYFHQRDMVVVISGDVFLAQFTLDAEGKVINESKIKLSCGPHPDKLQGVWAGYGLLATTSHESIVRLWNLVDDESYILSLQGIDERNSFAGDKVTSIDFNPRKRVLVTGTKGGRIVQWRCSTLSGTPKSEDCWQVLPAVSVPSTSHSTDNLANLIGKVMWGPGENLLYMRTERSSMILYEAQLNSAVHPPYIAVQTAPMQVSLCHLELEQSATITASFRVKGLGLAGSFVMLWNSKQVTIFKIKEQGMATAVHSAFKHDAEPIVAAAMIAHSAEPTIAVASGDKIEFINLQGQVQKVIAFSREIQGVPVCLDVKGNFLVASTAASLIRVWNVSRAQPKEIVQGRKFEGASQEKLGDIRSVRINCDGTRVSMLVDQRLAPGAHTGNGALRVPDSRLFVYDLESDSFLTYSTGKNHVPVTHLWECSDPRLMACEIVPQALAYNSEDQNPMVGSDPSPPLAGIMGNLSLPAQEDAPTHAVATLFVSGSERILVQDSITCADAEHNGAPRMPVAIAVPHLYFARQLDDLGTANQHGTEEQDVPGVVSRTALRDFVGLENVDPETCKSLLNFSFHLAGGNTDEAYKSVKGVQSAGVWESMCKMCVKTGRLDVAQKCLGQMSHARAAGALRVSEEPEPEARLAVVAVHLDMVEEAERLLQKCRRFDLLNLLYQACGEWEKALEVAKTKDRLHLKPTYFAYAQHLESIEDVQGALANYELSGTYRTESPRLLCSLGMTQDLEAYIEKSEDMHLHKWYAQYLESKADLGGAAREYKKADDWLSLCRVACFNKDLEKAQKICDESQDPAACYHLARHLESEGRTKDAIHFFQVAGRVSHALRLAKDNGLDGDLMNLALSSDPASMAKAAKYYEQKNPSKAVMLYQKAGYQKQALDLCFSARLFDALRSIADDLSAESDPEVLSKCAEFFMQHNQHEKAVHLLSMSKQFEKAVDLCAIHENVQISEDMAERMTPDKNSMESAQRSEILKKIAGICKKQGSFQIACKKYTQAGDKLKAMRCLLKSGDTEKIIFFAGTARHPEIYVLAGNYLQSLDWHGDSEIMKNIIQFYSKAKAYDKLAAFYDACAQVEIDEYRDYEKAGGALREALKYLVKVVGGPPASDNDPRVQSLQGRIAIVDQFSGIKKLAKTDPEQVVLVCHNLLAMGADLENSVRLGDVFAQLVEHYASQGNYADAHRTVEQMRGRGVALSSYIDRVLIDTVYRNVGLPTPEGGEMASGTAGMAENQYMDDGVDEEIEENM